MNIEAERAAITAEDLTAAFRASRLKHSMNYGLFTALQIPAVRRALELHAIVIRRSTRHRRVELIDSALLRSPGRT